MNDPLGVTDAAVELAAGDSEDSDDADEASVEEAAVSADELALDALVAASPVAEAGALVAASLVAGALLVVVLEEPLLEQAAARTATAVTAMAAASRRRPGDRDTAGLLGVAVRDRVDGDVGEDRAVARSAVCSPSRGWGARASWEAADLADPCCGIRQAPRSLARSPAHPTRSPPHGR